MDYVIKIIGIVFVLIAIAYLIKPEILKWMMKFFRQGKRIYFAGILRFALAIIFLLGARECDITPVIVTLGILFLISGLLIFTIRYEKLISMLDWYQKQSFIFLRILAVITLIVGGVIIYSA